MILYNTVTIKRGFIKTFMHQLTSIYIIFILIIGSNIDSIAPQNSIANQTQFSIKKIQNYQELLERQILEQELEEILSPVKTHKKSKFKFLSSPFRKHQRLASNPITLTESDPPQENDNTIPHTFKKNSPPKNAPSYLMTSFDSSDNISVLDEEKETSLLIDIPQKKSPQKRLQKVFRKFRKKKRPPHFCFEEEEENLSIQDIDKIRALNTFEILTLFNTMLENYLEKHKGKLELEASIRYFMPPHMIIVHPMFKKLLYDFQTKNKFNQIEYDLYLMYMILFYATLNEQSPITTSLSNKIHFPWKFYLLFTCLMIIKKNAEKGKYGVVFQKASFDYIINELEENFEYISLYKTAMGNKGMCYFEYLPEKDTIQASPQLVKERVLEALNQHYLNIQQFEEKEVLNSLSRKLTQTQEFLSDRIYVKEKKSPFQHIFTLAIIVILILVTLLNLTNKNSLIILLTTSLLTLSFYIFSMFIFPFVNKKKVNIYNLITTLSFLIFFSIQTAQLPQLTQNLIVFFIMFLRTISLPFSCLLSFIFFIKFLIDEKKLYQQRFSHIKRPKISFKSLKTSIKRILIYYFQERKEWNKLKETHKKVHILLCLWLIALLPIIFFYGLSYTPLPVQYIPQFILLIIRSGLFLIFTSIFFIPFCIRILIKIFKNFQEGKDLLSSEDEDTPFKRSPPKEEKKEDLNTAQLKELKKESQKSYFNFEPTYQNQYIHMLSERFLYNNKKYSLSLKYFRIKDSKNLFSRALKIMYLLAIVTCIGILFFIIAETSLHGLNLVLTNIIIKTFITAIVVENIIIFLFYIGKTLYNTLKKRTIGLFYLYSSFYLISLFIIAFTAITIIMQANLSFLDIIFYGSGTTATRIFACMLLACPFACIASIIPPITLLKLRITLAILRAILKRYQLKKNINIITKKDPLREKEMKNRVLINSQKMNRKNPSLVFQEKNSTTVYSSLLSYSA